MFSCRKNRISSSLEDYLEVIYHLISKNKIARAKEIASNLNVANSSVSGALHNLKEKGLINYAPYEVITLTTEGEIYAKEIVRCHEILSDFFTNILLIDKKSAEKAACKMEHAVTSDILEQFIKFIEFIKQSPCEEKEFVKAFSDYCNLNQNIE